MASPEVSFFCPVCFSRLVLSWSQVPQHCLCPACKSRITPEKYSSDILSEKKQARHSFWNFLTNGAYREFQYDEYQCFLREIQNKQKEILKSIQENRSKLDRIRIESTSDFRQISQQHLMQQLEKKSIDDLKEISGIGNKTIVSLKKAGFKNFKDPNRLIEFASRKLSASKALAIRDYVSSVYDNASRKPPLLNTENPTTQKIVLNLLAKDALTSQNSKFVYYKNKIKETIGDLPKIGFLKFVFGEIAPDFKKYAPFTVKIRKYSKHAKLLKTTQPEKKSFKEITGSQLAKGFALLEKEFGITPSKQLDFRQYLGADLVNQIEEIKLNLANMTSCTLRVYQEFAAKFMILQKRTFIGDEMGLGKTIQALALISHISTNVGRCKTLVISPASICPNWAREIEEKTIFTPYLLQGRQRRIGLNAWQQEGGIAVVSYSTLRQDIAFFSKNISKLDIAIADEVQYIKNPQAQRSQAASAMFERSEISCVMTGTPIENHPKEFSNIVLAMNGKQIQYHDGIFDLADPETFKKRISHFYLRRKKIDVLRELPPLNTIEEWVELSQTELRAHRDELEIGTPFMTVRKNLLIPRNEKASKIFRALELIKTYLASDRKVVIFSFFKHPLALINKNLSQSLYISGETPSIKRQNIIDKFQNQHSNYNILLAQIDVGGVGLNLQEASAAILLEPQLNPAKEYQAISRLHRMGQKFSVNFHRLLAQDSVEERIEQMLEKKRCYMRDYANDSLLDEMAKGALSKKQILQAYHDTIETIDQKLESAHSNLGDNLEFKGASKKVIQV